MQDLDNRSDMDIAFEYIAANPELTNLEDEAFLAFWQYPKECIAQHQKSLRFLRERFQFTDEQVAENSKDYLSDACKYIADLKAKDSQIL